MHNGCESESPPAADSSPDTRDSLADRDCVPDGLADAFADALCHIYGCATLDNFSLCGELLARIQWRRR